MMNKVFNFEQYTPEWWEIRAKKLTASHAQEIGNCGAGLKSYTQKLMQEYYSTAEPDNYSDFHMKRGLELEDSAAFIYSADMGIEVQKVGFVVLNDYVGCSPDLLTADGGLCEIKCHADKAHFALILGGSFESKYAWQAQCQMLITEREYCDLFSYNPNFGIYSVRKRLYPDPEKFEKLHAGFKMGQKLIEEIERKMDMPS